MEKHVKSRSLVVPAAIAKLRDTAQVITRRGGLRKSELKRVPEAFAALTSTSVDDVYEGFLRKVYDVAGPQMVVLCAVGLGRTAIKGMKDRVRVDLPFEIKNEAAPWENAFLQSIVDQFMQPDSAIHAGANEGQLNTSTVENVTTRLSGSQEAIHPEGRTQELNVHLGIRSAPIVIHKLSLPQVCSQATSAVSLLRMLRR